MNTNKKVILTRSSSNRILKILRVLPKKDMDGQLMYLTCHMMRASTGEEKQLLKQYEKGRSADRDMALEKIKQSDVYQKVAQFWDQERLDTLLSNKSRLENYRGLTFSEDRTIDEAETTVTPPAALTEVLEFLRLCY
jgi:hypothetical protein